MMFVVVKSLRGGAALDGRLNCGRFGRTIVLGTADALAPLPMRWILNRRQRQDVEFERLREGEAAQHGLE